jgi:ankyrin repeat protein
MFGKTQAPPSSPANAEMPLLNHVNGTNPPGMQPQTFRRGGNNPTLMNRALNTINPLKSAEKKKYRLFKAAETGDFAMVKAALDDGADPNTTGKYGDTPLIIASFKGHLEVARELLARGADVNAREDYFGRTPLYLASWKGHLEVVRELLARGARLELKDWQGRTALYWASKEGQVEVVRELLAQGAAVGAEDNKGLTPLFVAIDHNQLEVVRELLARGAGVETANSMGLTPL